MKRFQILFLLCLALSFTFSIFAQDKDTKEVIILQTSDVHSRIEPVNQKGDEYYNSRPLECAFTPNNQHINI